MIQNTWKRFLYRLIDQKLIKALKNQKRIVMGKFSSATSLQLSFIIIVVVVVVVAAVTVVVVVSGVWSRIQPLLE